MGVGPHVDPADPEPAGHAEHRHADGQHDQRGEWPPTAGTPIRPSRIRRCGRAAPVPIRAYRPPPRAAFSNRSRARQQHDEHAGQRRGGRAVERRAVLLDDRRGEGIEAEHREGAVLGQQVQTDEQPATEDRQPELRDARRRGRPGAGCDPGWRRPPRGPGRGAGAWRRPAGRSAGSTRASRPGRLPPTRPVTGRS